MTLEFQETGSNTSLHTTKKQHQSKFQEIDPAFQAKIPNTSDRTNASRVPKRTPGTSVFCEFRPATSCSPCTIGKSAAGHRRGMQARVNARTTLERVSKRRANQQSLNSCGEHSSRNTCLPARARNITGRKLRRSTTRRAALAASLLFKLTLRQ